MFLFCYNRCKWMCSHLSFFFKIYFHLLFSKECTSKIKCQMGIFSMFFFCNGNFYSWYRERASFSLLKNCKQIKKWIVIKWLTARKKVVLEYFVIVLSFSDSLSSQLYVVSGLRSFKKTNLQRNSEEK